MKPCDLIVVGCSWGGLEALRGILGPLPDTYEIPVVAAQHRSPQAVPGHMASALEARISLPVREVEDKDTIRPGHVYIAPPDYHLLIEPGSFALSVDEKVQYSRPSIDVLFESAADAYRERLVAVILTGANKDGAAGFARVKKRGGTTIAQDPSTAERSQMPQAAIDTGAADMVLSLEEISDVLLRLSAVGASEGAGHVG
ncbi:MAG: two-component system, chemotaxis family, protein-glutamate methylesterase/glutaminase [Actinomycetota bacterium]|nr:two-component system, chemotaxis family, protein-glutamate methylesterase/glutaminase [Actinomycetota bacterium]